MKYFALFFACYLFSLSALSSLDLKSLFHEAKMHNKELKSSAYNKDILQEQRNQVRSTVFPSLSLNASFTQLNQSRHYANRNLDDTNEVVTLKGVQKIFSGLKEFYTLQKLNALYSSEELQLKAQEIDLLTRLSTVYFSIVLQQEKISNTKELLDLSKEREDLLRQRVKIGKSRTSEFRQAKVQTRRYELQMQESQMLLKNSWDDLVLLVGKDLPKEKLPPYLSPPYNVSKLDYYKLKILEHPLLKSEQESITSLEKEKNSWKSDYFPVISLTGNYYANAAQTTSVSPEWDFGLTISYPFFEGGLTKARIAETSLKIAKNHTELEYLRESLTNEVQKIHETLVTKQQQYKTIDDLCADNKNNYLDIKKEYAMGLVSNLDVVTSLNTYIESLNQKVENSIDIQFNFVVLKSLVGDEL